MKAAVYREYGPPDVLRIEEVNKPAPGNNELLIKIHTATVSAGDARLRRAEPFLVRMFFGLFKPKVHILGLEFAGTIEAAGNDVTKFKPGDEVFGSAGLKMGTHAEYITLPEDAIITHKPASISFKDIVPVAFGGLTALHFLRQANIKPEQKVLIYGASGSLGTAALQLAKHFGAEVTGVCSTANIELVKSLGADHIIDYTKEDFTQNRIVYDVIFDTVGKSPFSASLKSLTKSGYYLRSVNISPGAILGGLWTKLTSSRKVIGGVTVERLEDLEFIKGLIESGKYKPVIDKIFPLDEIVAAHQRVDSGHKKGNVVIKISD